MKTRGSKIKSLHAAAEVRLQDFLSASLGDQGSELPCDVRESIRTVIDSDRKTYRYMMFVGLLVSVTDQSLHPRCLQLKAACEGAFDARSLCKSVVVPFEKKILKGRLGGSCDPYVSNPARLPMVEKNNDVKSAIDRNNLSRLYDVLEYARNSTLEVRRKLFRYAYACVLSRPPLETSIVDCEFTARSGMTEQPFFDFLEKPTHGASAVAVLVAFFRRYFDKSVIVSVHPLTESGSSSHEVGDIDLRFRDGRNYAVEVKAKPYTDVDVNHACEKALKSAVRRVIFAYGPHAEKTRPQDGVLRNLWQEKGIELSFMPIESALNVVMTVSDESDRVEMSKDILMALIEMNAPDSVKHLFSELFGKE